MSSTAKLTVYRGRDNKAKFGIAYKDGDVVNLTSVTKVDVIFGGVTFSSSAYPTLITWSEEEVFRGATNLVLALKLGQAAGLSGVTDGTYTDGKVIVYDPINTDGYEVDTRLTVTVR